MAVDVGGTVSIFDRSNAAFREMLDVTDVEVNRPFMNDAKARAKRYQEIHGYFRTGFNRDSIIFRKVRGTTNDYRLMTTSGYGAFLELGTVKLPARPATQRAVKDTAAAWRGGKRDLGF